jgi:chromosome segregation ATPase
VGRWIRRRHRSLSDQKALNDLRAPVEEAKKKAEDFSARLKAYGARVENWNQRVSAHNEDKKQGPQWERQGKELAQERDALEKDRAAFEVEKNALQASSNEAVRNFNDQRRRRWSACQRVEPAQRQVERDLPRHRGRAKGLGCGLRRPALPRGRRASHTARQVSHT